MAIYLVEAEVNDLSIGHTSCSIYFITTKEKCLYEAVERVKAEYKLSWTDKSWVKLTRCQEQSEGVMIAKLNSYETLNMMYKMKNAS